MSVKQTIVYLKTTVGLLKLVPKHATILGIPAQPTMMGDIANSETQLGSFLHLLWPKIQISLGV